MNTSALRRITSATIAILGVGCSNLRVRTPDRVNDSGLRDPRVRQAVGRSGAVGAEVRRVCRGSLPGGFVAIDYVADTTGCAATTGARSRYATAIVARYDRLPVDDAIAVCADQRIPTDWARVQDEPDDSHCPGEESSNSRATVMTIRRVR